jgi:AraC-like DNA-binding protein
LYYNLIYTLMLLGAIQGIGFTILTLFTPRLKSKTNFFLAMLILCFSLNNLQYYFWETDILSKETFFGVVYIPFGCLSIVMYYYYILSFLYPKSPIKKKHTLLLLPFLVFFLLTSYYKIGNGISFLSDGTYAFFHDFIYIHEAISILFTLIVLGFCFRLISRFEKSQSQGKTQIPKVNLVWLKSVSIICFFLSILWIFALLDELKNGSENLSFFFVLWISMSFTIYILGHIGLYRFGVLQQQKKIQSYSQNIPAVLIERVENKNEHIEEFEKFIKTDKHYLDSNLSLEFVAVNLNLNKSYLSRLINQELGISFTDYVNELRIEEAKRYLSNPDFENYTLVAIGLEAGFNSKTAFNTSFKKFAGMTPSEYKKTKRANI